MLRKPSDPRQRAKTRSRGQFAFSQERTGEREDLTTSRHRARFNSTKGSAMRWGWRSAKAKLKKGNSVMV